VPVSLQLPRLVVAGGSGDSGKTLIALGLALWAQEAGLETRCFKKGPDYIDAAWLAWAASRPARNLDTFLMGFPRAVSSFGRHAAPGGVNLVEGNRGLYDGLDAAGGHSTAELAKALNAPVLLVVNAAKTTRTAAAWVLGCQKLDPGVEIGGVVLNYVAGARHEKVVRESIESICGVPVLGVVPKAPNDLLLPERHLGLVTPEEHPALDQLRANIAGLLQGRMDYARILELARKAPAFAAPVQAQEHRSDGAGLRVGYLRDSALTFYYPENLEGLAAAGAELIPISALTAPALPAGLHALYIGGGFPETHAAALSGNHRFLRSLQDAARRGLPVYAECGGLMLLSKAIRWQGRRFEMAAVLPFEVEVLAKPQGHGYTELTVDGANPFFPRGMAIKGHEFHYSRILLNGETPRTACAVGRGTGCFGGRDGVVAGNVFAGYTHLHALATPEWVHGMISAARRYAGRMQSGGLHEQTGTPAWESRIKAASPGR
jgi:cobyrinic acid a,c-diamide synthase